MPPHRTYLALLLCLSPAASGLRADDADAEIPAVGRPANLPFSGASGDFRVSADAEPKTLEAQAPLTLTLRVEAIAEVRRPPQRIDLSELPSFKDRFIFEGVGDGGERRPNLQTWEFVYRLHPKREDVTTVPGIPFVFYNPEIQYPRKGFQAAYTDPIRLTVKEHEIFPTILAAPPFAFTCTTGAAVLVEPHPWPSAGVGAVAAILLAPPLLCVAWFLGWRRLYPDAASLAQRRRSLAARRALQALRGAGRLPPVQQAARAAAVTADYLRGRLNAPAVELTPDEAAACLSNAGCPPVLAEQAGAFFRDCDAARFAPSREQGTENREQQQNSSMVPCSLAEAAARFILAVEAETWSASRS